MLLKTDTPRPTFASVFADTAEQDVLFWISKQEAELGKDAFKRFIDTLPDDATQMRKLLESLSAGNKKADAFVYCEQLKNVLGWPVNGDLAIVFLDAFKIVNGSALRRRTIEWVMKTGTRFDRKPGDEITFYDQDKHSNRRATVVEVDRPVARAKVKVTGDVTLDIPVEVLVA